MTYKKGQGFSSSLKHAKGRTSFAENPLAYLQIVAFKAIGEQTDNEVNNALLNLVVGNYGDEFQKMYKLKKAYYVKVELPDGEYEWEMTIDRPSEEMFASGNAKTKIYEQYQKLRTPSQAHEYEVYIKRPGGDMIVIMKNEYLDVAQVINKKKKRLVSVNLNSFSTMKKPTSTFWICISILFASIIISGSIYLTGKDNGRYEYQSGLVIDKKTGEAKPININRE